MMERIDGFILAAGLGTRMGPLSRVLPKPAWPLLGRPILLWGSEAMHKAGLRNVGCNAHHLPGLLEAAAAPGGVEVFREPLLLGSAGGLVHVAGRARDPLAVWNGDAIGEVPWRAFLEAHRRLEADLSWLLVPHPGGAYNGVDLDGEGRIRLGGGPYHFTGASLWGPKALALLPRQGPCDVKTQILPRLGRPMGVLAAPFPLVDVGSPDHLLEAAALLAPEAEGRIPGCYVHPTAEPAGTLRRCILGPGARIPAGFMDSDALWFEECGRQVRLAL